MKKPSGRPPTISVIIPTYQRERVLIETLESLAGQIREGDEILVIDQTPVHEPATKESLERLAAEGTIRWFRRRKPNICEAMNVGAHLANGEVLVFLDDDVIPAPQLLQAHREALSSDDAPPAICGQVLQPWDAGPVEQVRDFAEDFSAAYCRSCDILALMAGNFAIRRRTFLEVGGMDENFTGGCYRLEAELSYRIFKRTGRKVRFEPAASIRHLHAGGGTRAFGHKDTWGNLGGSIGDYYFALRSLPPLRALRHCLRRLLREPLNRETVRRPWRIPSLWAREIVALGMAVGRIWRRPDNTIKEAACYEVNEPVRPVKV